MPQGFCSGQDGHYDIVAAPHLTDLHPSLNAQVKIWEYV